MTNWGNATLAVPKNAGTGIFGLPNRPNQVSIGDFNRDGKPDVWISIFPDSLAVLLNETP